MTIVLAWWFISARHWFKGPVINIEVCLPPLLLIHSPSKLIPYPQHHMIGREVPVTEGIERISDSDSPSLDTKVKGETMTTPTPPNVK